MKQLTRNATSEFVCTLKEKQTLTAPYWLFRFVKDGTNEEVTVVYTDNDDTSTNKTRYNRFSITEGGFSPITLPSGIWTYYIYEQTTGSNTNYVNSTSLCETGQVKVVSTVNDQIPSAPDYNFQYSETTQ
jgi:hypothetical protein